MKWYMIVWKQFENAKQIDVAELVRGDNSSNLLRQMMAVNAQKRLSTTEYRIIELGELLNKHKLKVVDDIEGSELNTITSFLETKNASEIAEELMKGADFFLNIIDKLSIEELKEFVNMNGIDTPYEPQPNGTMNIDLHKLRENIKRHIVKLKPMTDKVPDSQKLKTIIDANKLNPKSPIQSHKPVESVFNTKGIAEPALKEEDGPQATDSEEGEEVKIAE